MKKSTKTLQAVVKSAAGDIILMYEIEPGFKKTRVFFKKPNPVGFLGFYWVLLGTGFYWFFCQDFLCEWGLLFHVK